MSEANKALARRWYAEVFAKKNLRAIDELVSPHVLDHAAPPGTPAGIEGAKQILGMYLAAFPDVHLAVEDMIAEGDKVVVRYTIRGTHKGDLMGIPPTGKPVTLAGIEILRVAGGKIVEHWESLDELGMMRQLGVIPAPGQQAQR